MDHGAILKKLDRIERQVQDLRLDIIEDIKGTISSDVLKQFYTSSLIVDDDPETTAVRKVLQEGIKNNTFR